MRLIKDVMTRGIKTIKGDTSLAAAAKVMNEASVRHLPVVEGANNNLVGLISDRDIKKFVSPFALSAAASDKDKMTLNVKVEKVMTREIIKAHPSDPLKPLVEIILQKKIGCVPVIDDNDRPIGIITR